MMLPTAAFRTVALFLLLMSATKASSSYHHLEEILLGRCYFDPPFSNSSEAHSCPEIVAAFLDILNRHSDATLQADQFFEFLHQVDLTVASNQQPMIWLEFLGEDTPDFPIPPHFVTPETTPAGRLVRGLVFCGAQQEDCTIENSRAYWKFWQAAYYQFTNSLHTRTSADGNDRLTIVVEPLADMQFLERSIVPVLVGNLIPSAAEPTTSVISKVTIYETRGNCEADNVKKLMEVLRAQQMKEVTCRASLWELWDHKENEAKEEELDGELEEDIPDTSQMESLWLLLSYLVLALAFSYCAIDVMNDNKRSTGGEVVGERSPLLWKEQKGDDEETCSESSAGDMTDLTKEDFEMQ